MVGHGGLPVGTKTERDPLQGELLVRRTFRDDVEIEGVVVALPDNLEVLALLHVGVINAAVIGGRVGDLAVGQELRRLGAGLPPLLDVGLDFVELPERPVDTLGGAQQVVNPVQRHAVGHQRELEIRPGRPAQGARAGEFLDIPEIGPGLGRLFRRYPVGVIGEDGRPEDGAGRAFLHGGRVEGILAANLFPELVGDYLDQACLAQDAGVPPFHVDDVPFDIAGGDHGLDLAELAAVAGLVDYDARLLGEGLDYGLALRVLVAAAKGNEGQYLLGSGGRRGHQAGGKYTGKGDRCCLEQMFHFQGPPSSASACARLFPGRPPPSPSRAPCSTGYASTPRSRHPP